MQFSDILLTLIEEGEKACSFFFGGGGGLKGFWWSSGEIVQNQFCRKMECENANVELNQEISHRAATDL